MFIRVESLNVETRKTFRVLKHDRAVCACARARSGARVGVESNAPGKQKFPAQPKKAAATSLFGLRRQSSFYQRYAGLRAARARRDASARAWQGAAWAVRGP